MDDKTKSDCFNIVYDTTIGAIGGFVASAAFETASISFVEKTLKAPSLKRVLESSTSTVPISAGISLLMAYREIRARDSAIDELHRGR